MMREPSRHPTTSEGPSLSAPDAAALDALLEAGRDLQRHEALPDVVPAGVEPQRWDATLALSRLLDSAEAPAAPKGLAQRTLNLIARERAARVMRLELAPTEPAFRLSELVAIAASLVLGVCVIWPVLDRTRSGAREAACRSNLQHAGIGLARYAGDHDGVLPRGQVEPDSPWYLVGERPDAGEPVRSNSAHLYLLLSGGYTSASNLACPENSHARCVHGPDQLDWPDAQAVSFSYQNQYGRGPVRAMDNPGLVVLADKNPQFRIQNRTLDYLDLPDQANSPLHGGRGQNLLRADGAALWSDSPVLPSGDVIYKARGVGRYRGTEAPAGKDDSFIVP